MAYQNLDPLSKQLTIVIGLTVVGFMAFGLALSFYRNFLFEETLNEIRVQNDLIRDKIYSNERDLAYYQSDQYKDKYAKENLGLVKHGEKVLIITTPQIAPELGPDQPALDDRREAAFLELLRQMPIVEHWKLFFFHPEKIEQLKKAL